MYLNIKRFFSLLLFLALTPSVLFASPLKIGVFTGTFDPPHNMHVLVVESGIKKLDLDIVLVSPNFSPPHKPDARPFDIRLKLTRIAFESVEQSQIFDAKLLWTFKQKGVDGVFEELHHRDSNAQIFHLLGSDAVLKYGDKLAGVKYEFASVAYQPRIDDEIDLDTLPISVASKIIRLSGPVSTISSTRIRKILAEGRPSSDLHSEVNRLILELKLYSENCVDTLIEDNEKTF